MISAGHVADMISRIKYNESLKQSNRSRYARLKEAYLEGIHYHIECKADSVSPEKLEEVKQKIRADIKRERIALYIKSVITSLIILVPVIAYFYIRFFRI